MAMTRSMWHSTVCGGNMPDTAFLILRIIRLSLQEYDMIVASCKTTANLKTSSCKWIEDVHNGTHTPLMCQDTRSMLDTTSL